MSIPDQLATHRLVPLIALQEASHAVAMTTPGYTSMATVKKVEKVMKGGGARVR